MLRYKVSTAIPIKDLVRAYELWSTTDMSQREVARAIGVNHRTLSQAIKHAEEKGLYGKYLPKNNRKKVLEFIQNSANTVTTTEISMSLKLDLDITKQACYKLCKEKLIKRMKIKSTDKSYRYYT